MYWWIQDANELEDEFTVGKEDLSNAAWMPKCECGGDKTYGAPKCNKYSVLHSFWCPKGKHIKSIEDTGIELLSI
jgi:hypothetical protein